MNKREDYSYLYGIIAPVVTPYNEDGTFNGEKFREQAKFIMDAGVHGISPCGSTGEGCAVRDEERNEMIRIIQEENTRHIPVVAGIIRHSTRDAIKAAKEAKEAGADALMITPIQYLGGTDADGNYRYYDAISSAVDLPIIIYNVIPQNEVKPDSAYKMLKGIKNLVGVKQSRGSIDGFAAMYEKCHGEGLIFAATDEMPENTYLMGADGEIAAILGLFPELSVKIWDLHKEGKYQEAMNLQRMVYTVWMSITGPQFPRRLKAALECIGRGCGNALYPLGRASDEEFEQIRNALKPYIAYAKDNLKSL